MKQKLTAALLALACLAALTGCGKGDADPTGYTLEALDLMANGEQMELKDSELAGYLTDFARKL